MLSLTTAPVRPLVALALTALLLVGGAVPSQAQSRLDERTGLEFLVASGSLIPTGAQRDAIKRGNLTAVQLSYVVRPSVAITTTLGWARSRDIVAANDPKLDVFSYDLGVETRATRRLGGRAVTFSPFAGVGAGGRSYHYRSLNVDASNMLAAYGSVGGEFGYQRVRLRVEARNYVTGFKPLVGEGPTARRNDVALIIGLRINGR